MPHAGRKGIRYPAGWVCIVIDDLEYLESKPSTAFPELFSYDALLVTFSESISGAWMYLTGSEDFEQKVMERAREQNIIIPELVVTISDQPDSGCTLTVLGEPVCQVGNADEIGYFTSDRFLEDLVTRIIQEAALRFAGADWDSALEKLEKCNTRSAYRKLIWFYKHAVPDRKKAFHYAKKTGHVWNTM